MATSEQLYFRHSISGTIRLIQRRDTPTELVVIDVDAKTIEQIVNAAEAVLFVSGNLELNYSAYSSMKKSRVFFHRRDGSNGSRDWKVGDKVEVETDVTVAYEMLNGSALIKGFWEGRPSH